MGSRSRSFRSLVAWPRPAVALGLVLFAGCPDSPPTATSATGSSGTSDTTGPEPMPGTSTGPVSTSSGVVDDTSSSGGTSTSTTGTTGTTGDTQDCCAPHSGPGCDDPDLAACVCEEEAFCCAFAWDEGCVDLAEQCGGCGAGTGSTGSTGETTGGDPVCCEGSAMPGCAEDLALEACVCGLDPFCCDTQWDDQCVQEAIRQCGAMCDGGMGSEACCSPSGSPGCPEDLALEACVCALDAFCCDQQWDGMCVQSAQNDCGLVCPAGGDCCAAHGAPGCDDMAVNDCVCALDGFCCDTEWDAICVNEAQYACMAPCGLPPGDMGDCCSEQPGPGCGDVLITDCTCMVDGDCCLFPWDDTCIVTAVSSCALECAGVDPLDPCCLVQPGPGCGDAGVEACVCAFDAFCCDTQWDGICVDEAQFDCMFDCSPAGGSGSGTGGSSDSGGSST
jgi:hypothetical protein